jgi:hypothetical protein
VLIKRCAVTPAVADLVDAAASCTQSFNSFASSLRELHGTRRAQLQVQFLLAVKTAMSAGNLRAPPPSKAAAFNTNIKTPLPPYFGALFLNASHFNAQRVTYERMVRLAASVFIRVDTIYGPSHVICIADNSRTSRRLGWAVGKRVMLMGFFALQSDSPQELVLGLSRMMQRSAALGKVGGQGGQESALHKPALPRPRPPRRPSRRGRRRPSAAPAPCVAAPALPLAAQTPPARGPRPPLEWARRRRRAPRCAARQARVARRLHLAAPQPRRCLHSAAPPARRRTEPSIAGPHPRGPSSFPPEGVQRCARPVIASGARRRWEKTPPLSLAGPRRRHQAESKIFAASPLRTWEVATRLCSTRPGPGPAPAAPLTYSINPFPLPA